MKVTILLCFMLLFSCVNEEATIREKDYFFPLKTFMEKEIESKSGKISVSKTVNYNGNSESKKLNSYSLKADLQSFMDSDINKASLLDKYEGDTIVNGVETIYRYKSLSENLKTQTIEILMNKESVREIKIMNNGNSILRNFEENLKYQPDSGYEIVFDQNLIQNDEKLANIKVEFQ